MSNEVGIGLIGEYLESRVSKKLSITKFKNKGGRIE